MDMNKVNALVEAYNSTFTLKDNVVSVAAKMKVTPDFNNKTNVYKISNRYAQVCEMFELQREGVITEKENIKLQTRTKAYAVVTILKAIKVRKVELEVLNNTQNITSEVLDEVALLKAQMEELKAQLKSSNYQVKTLTNENIDLNNQNQVLRNHLSVAVNSKGLVTKAAKASVK